MGLHSKITQVAEHHLIYFGATSRFYENVNNNTRRQLLRILSRGTRNSYVNGLEAYKRGVDGKKREEEMQEEKRKE